jgi:hypothetical protein
MRLEEIGRKSEDWIHPAQDRASGGLVNTGMNLWVL